MTETRGQKEDDEDDWSQISSQVMRKRVQNRLAQRKHRKSVKAKLKELERLATQEISPTETTQAAEAAAAPTPAHGPLSAKDHPPGLRPEIPGLTSLDVSMPGDGFPLDGSSATTYIYNHHPPSSYPATVSGSGSLTIPPTLPVPFANNFPVSEWAGDGGLSPTNNLLPQGYADDMNSLGRYLEQQRHTLEGHDLQSRAKSSTTSSSWASSHRPGQSTDTSAIPDRIIMPSDSVSARENEISSGALSTTRTPLSKHGSRMSSGSPHLLDVYPDLELNQNNNSSRITSAKAGTSSATPGIEGLSINRDELPTTLSSRVATAIKAIRALGFSSLEELTAQFYTADLQDRPALADAQRISRRRGLTRILAKIREHAQDDWTEWEAQGYREEILRAAEDILGDECRRFSEEDARGSNRKTGRNITELKQHFQDELPNLYGLLGVLTLSLQQWGDEDHTPVIVHAISLLLHGSKYPESA
ncbi:hypothetical protein PISL3812_04758 [Talaromyces islandicus]|uniref:BZIP domain-containing protein n=1 Tax=Talaromyces islandicus TaxID=28573 RepID=A0A0U1LWF0_TALIS|nr:hypothetical protein PISL3812_04758 [Talaromyces islandicus]